MTLILPPKPPLSEFIETFTPLAIIDSLEAEMRARVESIADALLLYQSSDDPVKNLSQFLQADENFLGIILALTNLSQEKFLRILSAERFAQNDFGNEWKPSQIFRKLKNDTEFAERIAQLFLDGRNSPLLVEQVAAFYLDQLALPEDWAAIIQDRKIIQNAIRHKLTGEYNGKKGAAVESIIRRKLDAIQAKYGITYSKGQVALIGKEVDHAVPSTTDPYVFVMSSYNETTGSQQTTRANEQANMYLTIRHHNIRYPDKRVFVNFVDGAGWLSRRSDLRKMYEGCDYIINLKTLDLLEGIICRYVPERYFTVNSKPEVREG